VLAALSLQSVAFDLRERQYRRRQGPGATLRGTKGTFDRLDAVVLIAEPEPVLGGVTYHLVLHWKALSEPSMVLQSDTRAVPSGAPLNHGAAALRDVGMRYARALGLPFYDNAHFPSGNPNPILR
jgi:hypothetical protein